MKNNIFLILILLNLLQNTSQTDACAKCQDNDCVIVSQQEQCVEGCLDLDNRNPWEENNKLCNCKDSYYHTNFDGSGYSCQKCPEKCVTCEDTNDQISACKTCIGQFTKTPECNCDDSYAELDDDGICQCKKNFSQNKSENGDFEDFCTECPEKCDDCFYDKDFDVIQCNQCKDQNKKSFILEDGIKKNICTDCKDNFEKDTDNQCTLCKDSNKKTPECTDCQDQFQKDDDGLCSLCNDTNKKVPQCVDCKDSFKKDDGGLCNLCSDEYKKTPECTDCQDLYKKDNNGLCTICFQDENKKLPECTDCKDQFKQDDDGLCTLCSDNNKQMPVCTDCKEGFKKDDNGLCNLCSDDNKQTPECTDCIEKFKKDKNNLCTLCNDDNKQTPTCTDCKDQFTKDDNGLCTLCSDNNKKTPQCIDCKDSFKKDDGGLCNLCSDNNKQTPECTNCKDQFKLDDNGLCTLCSDNNKQAPLCTNCKEGFMKDDNGLCSLCSDKNKKTPECTNCKSIFKKDDNDLCNLCNDVNKIAQDCTMCKDGYYSQNDIVTEDCDKCQKPCQNCNKSKCLSCIGSYRQGDECKCKPNYYSIGDDQDCIPCQYPCLDCISENVCKSCELDSNRIDKVNCQCQDNYYEAGKGQGCLKCATQCNTCVDRADNCITCAKYNQYAPFCNGCVQGTYKSLNGNDCILDKVTIYDSLGTQSQKQSRCMSSNLINGVQNCQICRADKDNKGKVIAQKNENDKQGTFALRKIQDTFFCEEISNESDQVNDYDQEQRVPYCEVYDHYGLCRRCLVRYGLKWVQIKGEEDGYYTCVPNEYNVPFCHEYDQNYKCISCKWNQNDDEKDLYSNQKQEYQLDYALFTFNNKKLCINNLEMDMIIRQLDKNLKLDYMKSNCAQYNSDYKCIACHTRKYDYEGNVQWEQYDQRTGSFYESQDYIISDLEGGDCLVYPQNYITHPNLLKKVSLISKVIDQNKSQCKDGYTLYEDSDVQGEYGCGLFIEKCTQGIFNWDYESFQKTGLWHKKFLNCQKCEDKDDLSKEYITNGTQCIVAGSNYTGCQIIDTYKQCSKCKTDYIIVKSQSQFVECIKQKEIKIENCIIYDNYTRNQDDNTIVPICKECKFGYVPTISGQCSFVENLDTRGCPKKDQDKVGYCRPYPKFGWSDSGKCEYGIVRNIEQLCYTSQGLKKIENCKIYINTEKVSKCFKCENNYTRSVSMDACLQEPTNLQEQGGIEFCVQMDGPWCQRCLRDVKKDGVTIHYILTNQNTCIINTLEGANQNCVYATYGENNKYNRKLGKCIQCEKCYKLDVLNDNCVADEECLSETSKQIYLYTDIQKLVNGNKVDNCYIYRDKSGNCYECNRINGKNYGIFTDSNQKKICKECKPGQVLEKSINGEYICVTQVPGCIQYHENDYCTSCGTSFLSISDDGKNLQCKNQCNEENQVYDVHSRQKICLKGSLDTKCKSIQINSINRKYYEYFEQSDGRIGERCSNCEIGYFINANNNYKCENKDNFKNYKDEYSNSRVFSGITGDKVQVVVNINDKFMNGPCENQQINSNNYNVYIEQLNYCIDSQSPKAIFYCKIQDTILGDQQNCKQCYPGYILQNDQQQCNPIYSQPFLQYDYVIENCQYYKPDSKRCDVCQYGYILENNSGKCKKNPFLGCLQLQGNNNDNCSKCQYPFISVQYGTNGNKKCDLLIDGCFKQTKENLCDECLPGYQFDSISAKCLRRTQNCYDQDFSISYDYKETQTMRGDVCKGCFQNQDKIRLFYVNEKEGQAKLVKSCIYGCQQLKRKMNVRSPAHIFNTWECSSCRNNEYHISNNFGTKWCVKADRINNCLLFQQKVDNFKEVCILCKDNYYLNKSGMECTLCQQGLVPNCDIQDTQATSLVNNKCKCQKCQPNYYVTGAGECKLKTGDIQNCQTYDNFGNCTLCKGQNQGIRFLNQEGQCQNYSKDLNCGGIDGSNHSNIEDKCLRCDISTDNKLLNNSGKCVKGTIENCIEYIDSSTCKQCDSNFGLNYSRTECLNNENEKMQNNCFRYNEQFINGYLTCYECIRGYAIDYNFNDSQNEQCVKIDYCQKGYKKDGKVYCKECKLMDYENSDKSMTLKRVFRNKKPYDIEGTCHIYNKSAWQIDNCKYYSTYTDQPDSKNHCWQCHEGFSSDIYKDKGTQCISNQHPGALPGCKVYEIFLDGNKYQKYEDLMCRICYQQWRFNQDGDIIRFSPNTYSNSCDQTEQVNINLPPNVWTGKDGGLRSLNTSDNDNDDKDNEFLPNDREQYEDPELIYSNILQAMVLNCILVLIIAII